jgi:flagellar motor switch protein FliN/FliY
VKVNNPFVFRLPIMRKPPSTESVLQSSLAGRAGGENAEPPSTAHDNGDVVARVAEFAVLNPANDGRGLGCLDHLMDVNVTVTAELGRVTRCIGQVLKYGLGAVVELDRPVSEPVDLLVQGVRVGRGEVVVVDGRFAIRITEITDPKRRSGR